HLPLVRSIAKRYAGRGETVEDLVQVGALGLIRASDRFDPRRGVAFASFATPAIEGEIRRHLDDRTSSLRIPREVQRLGGRLERSRTRLQDQLGRAPRVDELASDLGVEVDAVNRALDARRAREPGGPVEDLAEQPDGAESSGASDNRLLLARGAQVLDERERRIVFLRFHGDLTEQQIARELGISQAYVSRLLKGALAKLRSELTREASLEPAGPETTSISTPPRESQGQAKAGQPKRRAAAGHSGRFLVRMPSDLHQQLTDAAEQEHVSLNRFITDALAASVSDESPGAPEPAPQAGPEEQSARRRFRMLVAANIVVIVLAVLVAVALLVLALEREI
ncbi:MAG: sigma-70 family RNA polymerase sigma factor, partial [Solirubrobacterales bacterium]|nr:sigma-70 family RNA polymerase sigma factor [Solirubrobacterales bacterium]